MLFFELFPAFVMVVSLIVAIALFVANRGAGVPKDSSQPFAEHPRTPAPDRPGDPRTGTRPSMRG